MRIQTLYIIKDIYPDNIRTNTGKICVSDDKYTY